MKTCTKCKKEKPLIDFYIYKSQKYRIGKPHCYCKECEKKIQYEWVEKNREKFNKYQIERYHNKRKSSII